MMYLYSKNINGYIIIKYKNTINSITPNKTYMNIYKKRNIIIYCGL